ncbi:hypothetical protein MRB53_004087 [Persea americana]|uniref:Uncharacterized protein n=1 Tax=Persea americana TaxID=3435 RepID=A0ACC2MZC2_PERAE|nr:hypothetical protein MRB53_004087 [Persea americana]
MKGKSKGVCSLSTKLGFPAIFLSCSLFFLAGFYASVLLSHDVSGGDGVAHRPMLLEVAEEEGEKHENVLVFFVLSWKPCALYFPRFASPDQCQSIIKIAKSSLVPSTLALRKGETAENTKGIRTRHSISYAMRLGKDTILIMMYVEEGGETMFPFENGLNMTTGYDYKKCMGLKVKPRQGDGLLFYSVFPNGTIDQTSLHESCPVIKGEKWVATKWIRDQAENED